MKVQHLTSNQDSSCSISEGLLPPSLQRVAEHIGLPATLRLVEARGGISIWVPTTDRCTPEHYLSRLIGFAALLALAELHGGEELEIPRAVAAVRAVRDARIREQYDGGKSQWDLALEYGLTERQIRNILNGLVAEEKQQALF